MDYETEQEFKAVENHLSEDMLSYRKRQTVLLALRRLREKFEAADRIRDALRRLTREVGG